MGVLQGGHVMGLLRGLILVYLPLSSWIQTVDTQRFGPFMMPDTMPGDNPFLRPNSINNPYSFNTGHRMLLNTPIRSSRTEPRGKQSSSSNKYGPYKPNTYYGNGPDRGYENRGTNQGGYGSRRESGGYGSQNRGYIGPRGESADYDSQNSGPISPEYVPGAAYPGATGPGYEGHGPGYAGGSQNPGYGGDGGYGYGGPEQGYPTEQDYPEPRSGGGYGKMRSREMENELSVEIDYGDGNPAQVITGNGGASESYHGGDKDGYELLGTRSSGHQNVLNDVAQFGYEQFIPGSQHFSKRPADYSAWLEGHRPPPLSTHSTQKRIKDAVAPYKYIGRQKKIGKKSYDVGQKRFVLAERRFGTSSRGKRKTNHAWQGDRGYRSFVGQSKHYEATGPIKYSEKHTLNDSPYYGSMGQRSHNVHREWDQPFQSYGHYVDSVKAYKSASSNTNYKNSQAENLIGTSFYDKPYATQSEGSAYSKDNFKTTFHSLGHDINEGELMYRQNINHRGEEAYGAVQYPSYDEVELENEQATRDKFGTRFGGWQEQYGGYGQSSMEQLNPGMMADLSPEEFAPRSDQREMMASVYSKDRNFGIPQRKRGDQSEGVAQRAWYKDVASTRPEPRPHSNEHSSIPKRKDYPKLGETNKANQAHSRQKSVRPAKRLRGFTGRFRQKMLAGLPMSLKSQVRPHRETLLSRYRSGYGLRAFPNYGYQRRSAQMPYGNRINTAELYGNGWPF